MSLLLSSAKKSVFFLPSVIDSASAANPNTAELIVSLTGDYSGTESGDWYSGNNPVIGNSFEIYAEEVAGPAGFVGTFDAWLPISEDRSWSLEQAGVGFKSGVIQFTIRRIGETSLVLSVETTFNVEVTA